MVLKIRLSRYGAKASPFYGIVLAQKRSPRDSKHIERLGTYNPASGERDVELDVNRIKYWVCSPLTVDWRRCTTDRTGGLDLGKGWTFTTISQVST